MNIFLLCVIAGANAVLTGLPVEYANLALQGMEHTLQ
jgi:hypothetical protein